MAPKCRSCGRSAEVRHSPWTVLNRFFPLVQILDALCLRCWRWGMLWMVGQGAATNAMVSAGGWNPY